MVYIYTYIHHKNQPNVGKYNIPYMDPMVNKNDGFQYESLWPGVYFQVCKGFVDDRDRQCSMVIRWITGGWNRIILRTNKCKQVGAMNNELVVEPTYLKNVLVKLNHFSRDRAET